MSMSTVTVTRMKDLLEHNPYYNYYLCDVILMTSQQFRKNYHVILVILNGKSSLSQRLNITFFFLKNLL